MMLAETVASRLEEGAARRLTRAAVALLQLDAPFREAFPRERLRRSESLPLEACLRACLDDPDVRRILPERLASEVGALLAPPTSATALPSAASRATLARALLDAACELAADPSRPHLVAGQLDWIRSDTGAAETSFTRALERARTRSDAAAALLHRSLLQADRGEIEEATVQLRRAAGLHPRCLAIHWSLAVYATATRRAPLADPHWRAALHVGRSTAIRARALALERHLLALADRGVTSHARARHDAARLLASAHAHLHPMGATA
jgi:tetratricopeptide (TPR) repeat protein